MAYFGSKSPSLIIITIFYYSAIFQSTNLTTAKSDSWLWPDEVESKIDERPKIGTDKEKQDHSFSFDEEGLTMRQERPPIVYQHGLYLAHGSSAEKIRRNSSAWKRLKTETKKPEKPSDSAPTRPSNVVESNWSFPEEKLPRRKAELECSEYSKVTEGKDVWIRPLGNRPAVGRSEGKSGRSKCKGIQNPLIIGGFVARAGEFSHMAALGWLSSKNKAVFRCGGSLISNRWVITAAHCTHGPSGPPKFVRIGARNLGETVGKVIKVLEIVRHPSYKPPAVYADLALLKLDKTVKFGADVKPACLYTNFDTTPLQAWATGWGVTGIGEKQSDELLKVRLEVVDNVDCALKFNSSVAIPRGIIPSMLCAGDVSGNWQRDTCQGDSGGPLQIFHPRYKCLHQIIGITSFGRLCALKNSPGVYTRISHYLDWIEGVVWPDYNR